MKNNDDHDKNDDNNNKDDEFLLLSRPCYSSSKCESIVYAAILLHLYNLCWKCVWVWLKNWLLWYLTIPSLDMLCSFCHRYIHWVETEINNGNETRPHLVYHTLLFYKIVYYFRRGFQPSSKFVNISLMHQIVIFSKVQDRYIPWIEV